MMISQLLSGRYPATIRRCVPRVAPEVVELIAVSVTTRAVLDRFSGCDVIDSVEPDYPGDKMTIPGSLQVLIPGDVEVVSGDDDHKCLSILKGGRVAAVFQPGEWYCSGKYHGEHGEFRRRIE